jgi:hypothetical protein
MARTILEIEDHSISGGNATKLYRLPRGYTYHAVMITGSAFTLAELTKAQLDINGSPWQIYGSGTFADILAQIDGRASLGAGDLSAETLILDIGSNTRFKTRAGQEEVAIGTHNSSDLAKLEADNGFATVQDLTLQLGFATLDGSPTVDVKALVSGPSTSGFIKRIRQITHNNSATGEIQLRNVANGFPVQRIIYHETGGDGDITQLEVEANNTKIWGPLTAGENGVLLSRAGKRVDVASSFVVDFAYGEGFLGEAFPTAGVDASDFVIKPTLGSGNSFTGYYETIEPFRG